METVSSKDCVFNDEVFKPQYALVDSNKTEFFPLARLPIELRQRIWRACLPPQRFIGICISDMKSTPEAEPSLSEETETTPRPYAKRNHLDHIISNYPYQLLVSPFQQWSRVLLRVNHEAQYAFQSFYRLSLPLQAGASSRLHLNPESDILEIHTQLGHNVQALVAFFNDAIAYDLRGIGITQLAIGREIEDVPRLANLDPKEMNPSALKALTTLCSRSLQTFYACISSGTVSRTQLGVLSVPGAPHYFNRSMPIAAQGLKHQSPSFKMFESDPRPIETDLSWVVVRADARRTVFQWRRIMAKFASFDTPSNHKIQIKFLQAIWPGEEDHEVHNRDGFIEYLKDSELGWKEWMSRMKKPLWGNQDQLEYERLKRELKDVAGIWVFEEEAFSELAEEGNVNMDTHGWGTKMLLDLRSFRPGLMVFDIGPNPR